MRSLDSTPHGVEQMIKTGKILRTPGQAPGLVSLEGQQYPFTLEEHWRSDEAPAVGMAVDAVLGDDGEEVLISLRHRDLKQETTERAAQSVEWVKGNAAPWLLQAADVIGRPRLAAVFLLYASWHWFDFVNMRAMGQSAGFTLVQLLPGLKGNSLEAMMGMASMSGGSAGFTGFLMWFSLLAPLIAPWIKHRRAVWLNAAPLAFLVYLYASLRIMLGRTMAAAEEAGAAIGGQFAREMLNEVSKAFSLGMGAYASLACCVFLAALAFRRSRSLAPLSA